MTGKELNPEDRELFGLVSEAAFANPFSGKRAELDRVISGSTNGAWRDIVPEAVREVSRRIQSLEERGVSRFDQFEGEERELMQHVYLFDVFHKYVGSFDELIVEQAKKGDQAVAVSFAADALGALQRRGFSQVMAGRYFSLFYQIRRAFHFIDRGLIGRCVSMRKLRMNLWNNIFTHDIRYYESFLWDRMEDFSTLLLGPTGSGKGAAAAAIGRSGYIPFDEKKQVFAESFTEAFVSMNLSQFPESLLESELFGHTKGAFTGAVSGHEGLLALCRPYGSIFLDEIGDVTTQVQIKLLRVLEDREFSPIGSHKKMKFAGRVIAATNRSLDELCRDGKFRDDFYYRLCSDTIEMPSLQQRVSEDPHELDDLIGHTVQRITGHASSELAATVKDVIAKELGPDYHWPGNVRELAQCVRRVIIKRHYSGDKKAVERGGKSELIADIEAGSVTAQDMLSSYCSLLYDKHGTYEEVSRITELDRRTVKKYIQMHRE